MPAMHLVAVALVALGISPLALAHTQSDDAASLGRCDASLVKYKACDADKQLIWSCESLDGIEFGKHYGWKPSSLCSSGACVQEPFGEVVCVNTASVHVLASTHTAHPNARRAAAETHDELEWHIGCETPGKCSYYQEQPLTHDPVLSARDVPSLLATPASGGSKALHSQQFAFRCNPQNFTQIQRFDGQEWVLDSECDGTFSCVDFPGPPHCNGLVSGNEPENEPVSTGVGKKRAVIPALRCRPENLTQIQYLHSNNVDWLVWFRCPDSVQCVDKPTPPHCGAEFRCGSTNYTEVLRFDSTLGWVADHYCEPPDFCGSTTTGLSGCSRGDQLSGPFNLGAHRCNPMNAPDVQRYDGATQGWVHDHFCKSSEHCVPAPGTARCIMLDALVPPPAPPSPLCTLNQTRCSSDQLEVQRCEGSIPAWVHDHYCASSDPCGEADGESGCFSDLVGGPKPQTPNNNNVPVPSFVYTQCDASNDTQVLVWKGKDFVRDRVCLSPFVCYDYTGGKGPFAACQSPNGRTGVWLPWAIRTAASAGGESLRCRNSKTLERWNGHEWSFEASCDHGFKCHTGDRKPYTSGCYAPNIDAVLRRHNESRKRHASATLGRTDYLDPSLFAALSADHDLKDRGLIEDLLKDILGNSSSSSSSSSSDDEGHVVRRAKHSQDENVADGIDSLLSQGRILMQDIQAVHSMIHGDKRIRDVVSTTTSGSTVTVTVSTISSSLIPVSVSPTSVVDTDIPGVDVECDTDDTDVECHVDVKCDIDDLDCDVDINIDIDMVTGGTVSATSSLAAAKVTKRAADGIIPTVTQIWDSITSSAVGGFESFTSSAASDITDRSEHQGIFDTITSKAKSVTSSFASEVTGGARHA
ncbi:hypothetical protein BDV95DRAFT_280774 [Massariosphaeria phaeospora]|uniref:Uncharacterized protein n=1 Tax=Massariosphaeria phaeospora TaxID=100035 RepID=A0A7C8MG40_9PLEO|nr:hypothetical protein BDV95DRAFT_280774 [Massariosphaeria phaeospora]